MSKDQMDWEGKPTGGTRLTNSTRSSERRGRDGSRKLGVGKDYLRGLISINCKF